MSNLVPYHGVPSVTGGRLDIRAMTKHYLAPYKAAEPYRRLIDTIGKHRPSIRRGSETRLVAAKAISKAVAPHKAELLEALNRLNIVLIAPDETDIRLILGAMLSVFLSTPPDSAATYVDALVCELMEPARDEPYALPAIAAAAREIWQTLPAPPSIAESCRPYGAISAGSS